MFIFFITKENFSWQKEWTKNSNALISRLNHQLTESQIDKPLSLKTAIVMSVNELSALILSGGFKLVHCDTYALCIVASDNNKTLFLERNSVHKGHKIPLTVTVTSPSFCFFLQARHLAACPLFFFFFFSPFLESRLVSFYFESHLEGGPLLFLFLFLWWPFYMQGSAV